MRQALQQISMRIVIREHSQEELKRLVEDYFKSVETKNFFLLIGNPAGPWNKFETQIKMDLGLPGASLVSLAHYQAGLLDDVIHIATNPNCVGVIAFGLEETIRDSLKKTLDEKGVGRIKNDPAGDSYAIFSTSRRIKPNELVEHLRKLLILFFDKDHLKQ